MQNYNHPQTVSIQFTPISDRLIITDLPTKELLARRGFRFRDMGMGKFEMWAPLPETNVDEPSYQSSNIDTRR